MSSDSDGNPLIDRVRRRMYWMGGLEILAGFAFGWRAGVSLTIAAAVVIFGFLVLERLTSRLLRDPLTQPRAGSRAFIPLLLVTVGSLALFAVILVRWKEFDPIAGAVGLSTVVLAIIPEIWIARPGRE
jgi:hypothetical protein